MSPNQQWEYKVVELSSSFFGHETKVDEESLNELGAEGWELVETLSEGGGNTQALVFKREK
ncbi:DUF4177 domain-containing protein [Haloarchaeobius amylolyticus]|uniref:DUF4177 domain-containing protein n=1 Tax=Haloarchaeobius amylolyticus TaxID=1198296 RepID=UPI00226DE958|nr:DUF4177 domain-containing protein [Haloarchaeobius amylolyticus]